MTILPLIAVGLVMKLVAALFVLTSLALILVVLVQKGKGGGLSATFGGGGAGGLMGSKTGDFLTWFTISLTGLFLLLAIIMAKYYKPTVGEYQQQQPAVQTQAEQSQTDTEAEPDANQLQ